MQAFSDKQLTSEVAANSNEARSLPQEDVDSNEKNMQFSIATSSWTKLIGDQMTMDMLSEMEGVTVEGRKIFR